MEVVGPNPAMPLSEQSAVLEQVAGTARNGYTEEIWGCDYKYRNDKTHALLTASGVTVTHIAIKTNDLVL